MLTEPHIFPRDTPPGYSYLDDEPRFEPERDLRLEPPKSVTTLRDLGYHAEFQADCGSTLAVSAPLRVLSDTGVEKLRTVIKRLWPYAVHSPDPRVAPVLRGAVYRSRFIRDLALSPAVVEFLGEVSGAGLVPTSFPHQLAHINYVPGEMTEAHSGWQRDTSPFVLVLMVHDPLELDGGLFQYFDGTRQEALGMLARGRPLPDDRLVSPYFPGAGHAVLMQGSTVLHRVDPLAAPCERLTLATSYGTRDVRHPDPHRTYFVRDDAGPEDPEAEAERFCRYVDYARHKAWRARGHLDDFIREVPWTDDRELIVRQLAESVREVVEAVDQLRRGDVSERDVLRLRAAEEARKKRRVS